MEYSIHLDRLTLGVCYYPEHWPESLWEQDLDRMLEAGISVCRIGEFAWSKFERTEGAFDFSFFQRFLDLAQRKGMKVIFCTPTATPPAWLTEKYPETLNAFPDGTLVRHGMRCHCNHTSPVFLKLCARVVEEIAGHYGSHPAIIGWQIDNEINCETNMFYSEADSVAFRAYLKDKFGTLEALNQAMGTVFWNQEYTDWEEIFVARPTLANSPNPHLLLEQKKFISENSVAFFKMQADIIKKYRKPGDFITTNGVFGHIDYQDLNRWALDFITYDSYPNFAYSLGGANGNASAFGRLRDRVSGLSLARVRSISPNFGIMEQQSGGGGWQTRMPQPAPRPGQMRLWAWQSIAHGADFVSFFRWRTCNVGMEIYWNGILPWDNRDSRQLEELRVLREETARAAELAGSRYAAKVAVCYHYPTQWDGEGDIFHGPLEGVSVMNWFAACQVAHTPMDLLCLGEDLGLEALAPYDLLVLPHIALLPEKTAGLLKEYVERGGRVIFGARTGFKDEFGRCPMRPTPGPAAELVGGTVREYTLVPEDSRTAVVLFGRSVPMPRLNEILEPEDGEALGRWYTREFYDGQPGVLRKRTGKGEAIYVGAAFSEEMASALLSYAGLEEPYAQWLDLPQDIELAVRKKGDRAYHILLNYTDAPRPFTCHGPMTDLLTGLPCEGEAELPPYGVMVLA